MDQMHVLREAVDYNYWARDRQLEACASMNEEQFLQAVGGSFPSLRDTFAHMVAVEWLWLERWHRKNHKTLIAAGEFPNLVAVAERWRSVECEMRAYLTTLDEETLLQPITCVSTRGEVWTYSLWRMIAHLLNHQSYHRGQITTQLRLLGVQPPRVDFLLGVDAEFRS
jgi:uncharacterized damage-inducible protein DinB